MDLALLLNLLAVTADWVAQHRQPLAVGAVVLLVVSYLFTRREPD